MTKKWTLGLLAIAITCLCFAVADANEFRTPVRDFLSKKPARSTAKGVYQTVFGVRRSGGCTGSYGSTGTSYGCTGGGK